MIYATKETIPGTKAAATKRNHPNATRGRRSSSSHALIGTISLFFFQAEDGIRDIGVTGVQTCALPISGSVARGRRGISRFLARMADAMPGQSKGRCLALPVSLEDPPDPVGLVVQGF